MAIKLNILGDSNVDRYFTVVKASRDDECIQNVSISRSVNLAQIKDVLLPNPITMHAYTEPRSLLKHCESVFTQLKAFIAEGRLAVPGDLEQVGISWFIFTSFLFI